MPEKLDKNGLPAIPGLDADQEDWILAWRKALGAYAVMAGYSDYLVERWGQEMAEAYLGPAYRGSPEDLPHIRTTAQRLGPIYPPSEKRQKSDIDTESRPMTHAESKPDAEAQLDMFEDFLL